MNPKDYSMDSKRFKTTFINIEEVSWGNRRDDQKIFEYNDDIESIEENL